LFDRAHFIHEHPGWTYLDYDAAAAGDILFDREYHAMIAPLAEGHK
jgi:hypothetical protein